MKKPVAIVTAVCLLILVLIIGLGSFHVVPTGYTGVVIRMGQVQQTTMAPGVHFKIPLVDKVRDVNNKQIEANYEGRIFAESSEQNPIYYEGIQVTYQISPSASVWFMSNVGSSFVTDSKALITPTLVSSAIKVASVELPTKDVTKRGFIEPAATQSLQESLNEKYGEGMITIIKLSISNADFEESYNEVIFQRQSAQIQYEQQQIENKTAVEKAKAEADAAIEKAKAEAETAKVKAEAEAKAAEIRAEADAKAMAIRAEAEANAKKITAEAEAEANKKIQQSLTPEILQKDMLDKWDGELPKVSGGDNGMIFDVTSVMGD